MSGLNPSEVRNLRERIEGLMWRHQNNLARANNNSVAERHKERLEELKQELARLREVRCEHLNRKTQPEFGRYVHSCSDCGREWTT